MRGCGGSDKAKGAGNMAGQPLRANDAVDKIMHGVARGRALGSAVRLHHVRQRQQLTTDAVEHDLTKLEAVGRRSPHLHKRGLWQVCTG